MRFLSICFVLLIVATSQSMAVARGQAAVAGEMVICNGNGTMTVLIDADGNPVDHPHICPDCTATLIANISEPASLMLRMRFQVCRIDLPTLQHADLSAIYTVGARAPPA
ncbi:hypothetical protein [Parasulfitobacter algicola]|uniref:DUF2946 domain-containing protein n=1 Tax=Parasulfitobacter algicola TaxID=2614809 RepID=A0ABX2INV4_9RHOB|nr:hypothetical protein [Sulfitobacter algicola]NSX54567.1 hypothetical protein [Sulfitobacter algicola]